MTTPRDEWVRVESEATLRSGMALKVVTRSRTRTIFQILLGRCCEIGCCAGENWMTSRSVEIGGLCLEPREAIADGNLYRLADLPPEASEAEAASPSREVERVR